MCIEITGFTLWCNQNSQADIDIKSIFNEVQIGDTHTKDGTAITLLSSGLHTGGDLGKCKCIKNENNRNPPRDLYESYICNNIEFKFECYYMETIQILSVNIYSKSKTKISGGASNLFKITNNENEKQDEFNEYTNHLVNIIQSYINDKMTYDCINISQKNIVNLTSKFTYTSAFKNMNVLFKHLNKDYDTYYEPEIFSGMRIRGISESSKTCTCILFHTGNSQILGAKCLSDIIVLYNQLITSLDNFENEYKIPINAKNKHTYQKNTKSVGHRYFKKAQGKKQCRNCFKFGHNKRTCKEIILSTHQM